MGGELTNGPCRYGLAEMKEPYGGWLRVSWALACVETAYVDSPCVDATDPDGAHC